MVTTLPGHNYPIKEQSLVYELRAKNLKAFNYLYQSYLPAISKVIKKVVGCSSLTEDVTQNAFAKVWVNMSTYNENKGSLYTWIAAIARNEAIDYIRSKNARESRITLPVSDLEIRQDATVYSRLDYNYLLRSLRILPPQDRLILELHSLGFTCKEIANKICLPEGSVKTRMRMSYKKLRFHLKGLN